MGEGAPAVLPAVEHLRAAVAGTALPLGDAAGASARRLRQELLDQLDDYVLPRLRDLDAPLLCVVGGSTGAGKSTLVNSLLRATVTAPGVLRPTTRSAVLAHAPVDRDAFTGERILPGLARQSAAPGAAPAGDPRSLTLVASDRVPEGLALLDAPDIDSVVRENRELAGQLLAAADLWVFVTTAARYADAVPWALLQEASERSAALAVVLDRVPAGAASEIRPHLQQMLAEHGLAGAPVFTVDEVPLVEGLLPVEVVAPLADWLHGLARDAAARAELVQRTLAGVLATYPVRVGALADASDESERALAGLRTEARAAYAEAADRVDTALEDGSVLRGEVLARWQEVVGTGELLRHLESRMGRLRDRVVSTVRGRPAPDERLGVALESGVETLVREAADAAAERTVARWLQRPGGRDLLGERTGTLARSTPGLAGASGRLVRDWQGAVLDLVRSEGAGRRASARALSYGVNGAALVVMVAVFASTGGLTGGELLVAGGASALGQKVLEALLGDEAVRRLAATARADLSRRVGALLEQEERRFTELLDALPSGTPSAELRAASEDVRRW
ncbi:hypothetical protein EV189_0749 [Motilibacter rhizosphaerae]|uniref:Dynamin family protein n=1 Tax=Motilibacter rhizosphaerae TaxID=598652 RepID=A0A4Q7NWC0_9ACTN|nr:ABC transporter [Motilibacter rhizosphaerae]RZS91507.1 hypothetical protein EV189_0749 [Motilibacter rhizosphaerae]